MIAINEDCLILKRKVYIAVRFAIGSIYLLIRLLLVSVCVSCALDQSLEQVANGLLPSSAGTG